MILCGILEIWMMAAIVAGCRSLWKKIRKFLTECL